MSERSRVLERDASRAPSAIPAVIAEDVREICARAGDGLRVLSGKTVVVAGGAGFLPSYVVDVLAAANETLLDEPCRVVCLDNLSTGVGARLAHLAERPGVVFVERDITTEVTLDERVDYVVHGASIASPTWYRRYPLETIDVNVTGTRNLLELAREHDAAGFLYLSSSEIYGDPPPDRIPTAEDYWGHVSSTGPRAPYDESKRLAETLCTTYHRLYGTPVKIVRPFNVYGPGLRADDGRVVPDFLRQARDGEPITVLSDGRATRSFCYISDFVTALILLLVADASGEAYNVGNDHEVTIAALAQTVESVSGRRLGIRYERSDDPEYLTDNPSRRSPDLTKTRATIDWRPEIDLETGLRRTLEHFRAEAAA